MITVTEEVQAILSAGDCWMADLIQISLRNGQVVRVAVTDRDIIWSGNTYFCPSSGVMPIIERGDITFKVGLEVDQMELTVHHDASHLICGLTWANAIRVGLLKGADVSVIRAVSPFWDGLPPPIPGVIPRFTGRVGPCQPGRVTSKLTVESLLSYLNKPVPANVYQAPCPNTLYDSNCGVRRAANETTVTITSVAADQLTFGVSGTLTAEALQGGFSRFVGTGGNVTQQVTVADNTAHGITLLYPYPTPLAVGDTLVLAPGCLKSMAACATYGGEWRDRFGGQPHVPVPETLL